LYFEDLSPYQYGLKTPARNVLNIGWLEKSKPFAQGPTGQPFLDQLTSWFKIARPEQWRGLHDCDFCDPEDLENRRPRITLGDEKTYLSCWEIWIPGNNDKIFAAPGLILHYVSQHQYNPPREFINAVMDSYRMVNWNAKLERQLVRQRTDPATELRKLFLAALSPRLSFYGFSYKETSLEMSAEYVRSRGELTDRFALLFSDRRVGFGVEAVVGISSETTNSILENILDLGNNLRNNSFTIQERIISVPGQTSKRSQFPIDYKEEIKAAVDFILDRFVNSALPYYECIRNIGDIDTELNGNLEQTFDERAPGFVRCCKGAIVARLASRPDYRKVASIYMNNVVNYSSDVDVIRFQNVFQYLESLPGLE
jgi:hypothetical protein